ncbi:CDP-diacylglycerol--glycerol-3-phosphate 3-phosphatidyltransferase [Clostridium acetobutylicum]|uniref:CDP-diacylglycerol--glycerol-3-phosphate 3-phosphatidyltransferase n=1 Tax=Clostridium acetobutylicum (strain ATCC 824 / DSM 792 / JCM 1419 / IAM 19013 / LMG 5710 / NBRC 13948 / NRRL B-527 / VKM B-1787 / 2291 / W) TaxID=272562 RepID=Q97D84_CLOAB|nr:CDP-diacylglycerol--glycerol-3-phosphate 3-phosphatidyltransferase [Clostridium acetobutylicum]AAK81519.1 Phosphatidylglycerophosphate synthase [Clostridium acetobutylicum ATCC 824]
MNIPNLLTLFRFFLIPCFIFAFFSRSNDSLINSAIIFFIAGFTDILDGYIARKFNEITKYGTVMDPLADKLMLLTVLCCLTIKGYIPLLILLIMLAKEFSMIIIGVFLYGKNIIIPANIWGKLSTLIFYVAILFFTFSKFLGTYLLYIAILGAVVAYINYFLIFLSKYRQNATK